MKVRSWHASIAEGACRQSADIDRDATAADNLLPIPPGDHLGVNHLCRSNDAVRSTVMAGARHRFWPLQDIVFVRGFMGVRYKRGVLPQEQGQTSFPGVIGPPHTLRAAIDLLTRLSVNGAIADRTRESAFAGCECVHDTPRM